MRFRITIRGDAPTNLGRFELRGYADLELDQLRHFARLMTPYGIVVGSVAEDDYNPFTNWEGGNPP